MTVKKIYLDMDGVLADFDRAVNELCGVKSVKQEHQSPNQEETMWNKIREIPHFYDKLELCEGAKQMFDMIYSKYKDNCEILTGIPKERRHIVGAAEDKINWVRRLLSTDIKINIVYKEDKKNFCSGKEYILIDDYSKNIEEWNNMGGTGLVHSSCKETIEKLNSLNII